ncbi:hypothetical protein RRG08_011078 [Elysia crispata]|uniref:ZSWIM1/3 RNaseH-like domain-containing protein n=1 Tax=Elysia crispata TaxID=231223 RepID=A0AAE0Z9U3_9GAST|nr:hypothetical protein RRG08_011078 [Elysia crispata]
MSVSMLNKLRGKRYSKVMLKSLRLKHSQSEQDDITKVEQFINSLKESGGDVAYGLDESTGVFQYLVYMSSSMKNLISRYPEVLIMDATYKTNHYLLPLLTVICIDQNGAGHSVLHAFIRHEDKTILGTCLNFLVDCYNSSQTSTIFVDKDLSEVVAIKSAMPQVEISLCRFHMKQAIKRAFQGKGLAAHIVKALQDIFEQQANALTEDSFNNFKGELSSLAPPPIVEYL